MTHTVFVARKLLPGWATVQSSSLPGTFGIEGFGSLG